MTLRIALLLLATWAVTRLTGPASDLVHTLLLIGLLLLLVGVLKARDAAALVPPGTLPSNQRQLAPDAKDAESLRPRAERGGR